MSPLTHFLASWIIAAKTTDNPRDCRLVTLAGILPDADGLGLVADMVNNQIHHTDTYIYYPEYHHWLMHGAFDAVLTAGVLACFARRRMRVALLCLVTFHLHLLCDLVGSRGPSPEDLWPIFYLGPFSRNWMWLWHGQWALYGWQNRVIGLGLFMCAMWIAVEREDTFVGVINRHADKVFVSVLKKWQGRFVGRLKSP
ncbi:MAG TPA: metal-dependent hydrolase [Verrucomicrobiae bacterium]|jgi:hypothetical protein|nr:metal-dependent hydrolase [Verrucomicrobiae bacterium]